MNILYVVGVVVGVTLTFPDSAHSGKVTAKKVCEKARSEVGYREGANNRNKFAPAVPGLEWAQNQPWCDVFTSWCYYKAGQTMPPGVKSASCATSVAGWKRAKRWSTYPGVGAQVFYGSGGGTHTGIVCKYDKTYIYTVEGNTNDNGGAEGNGVYKKRRVRRDNFVYGYGYPEFSHKIVSADPKYGGTPTGSA